MNIRSVVCAALVMLLASCAMQAPSRSAKSAALGVNRASPNGRLHGYVTARRVSDFIMVAGKEHRRVVEYGWDYDRAQGVRKTFDDDGDLLETRQIPAANIPLTPIEVARVHALVHAQPELTSLFDKPDVVIWGDGFAYRDPNDPDCGPGTRCIHVIVAADYGDTAIDHAIVDLQNDRVVHPFYQPSDIHPIGKSSGE